METPRVDVLKSRLGFHHIIVTPKDSDKTLVFTIDSFSGEIIWTNSPFRDVFPTHKQAIDTVTEYFSSDIVLSGKALIGAVYEDERLIVGVVTNETITANIQNESKNCDVYCIEKVEYFVLTLNKSKDSTNPYEKYNICDHHFYSTEYDLTNTFGHISDGTIEREFCWNLRWREPFERLCAGYACIVMIQGYVGSDKISDSPIKITYILRRSSANPGTRYNARGLNKKGYIGNEAECELIFQSYSKTRTLIWRRGTVPIKWRTVFGMTGPYHEVDREVTTIESKIYFDRLKNRFGVPIGIVSLLDSHDGDLPESYKRISHILKIPMLEIDVNQILRDEGTEGVLAEIASELAETAELVGVNEFEGNECVQRQQRILRFNCADSLDRTNLATYAYARHMFGVNRFVATAFIKSGDNVSLQYADTPAIKNEAIYLDLDNVDRTDHSNLVMSLKRAAKGWLTDDSRNALILKWTEKSNRKPGIITLDPLHIWTVSRMHTSSPHIKSQVGMPSFAQMNADNQQGQSTQGMAISVSTPGLHGVSQFESHGALSPTPTRNMVTRIDSQGAVEPPSIGTHPQTPSHPGLAASQAVLGLAPHIEQLQMQSILMEIPIPLRLAGFRIYVFPAFYLGAPPYSLLVECGPNLEHMNAFSPKLLLPSVLKPTWCIFDFKHDEPTTYEATMPARFVRLKFDSINNNPVLIGNIRLDFFTPGCVVPIPKPSVPKPKPEDELLNKYLADLRLALNGTRNYATMYQLECLRYHMGLSAAHRDAIAIRLGYNPVILDPRLYLAPSMRSCALCSKEVRQGKHYKVHQKYDTLLDPIPVSQEYSDVTVCKRCSYTVEGLSQYVESIEGREDPAATFDVIKTNDDGEACIDTICAPKKIDPESLFHIPYSEKEDATQLFTDGPLLLGDGRSVISASATKYKNHWVYTAGIGFPAEISEIEIQLDRTVHRIVVSLGTERATQYRSDTVRKKLSNPFVTYDLSFTVEDEEFPKVKKIQIFGHAVGISRPLCTWYSFKERSPWWTSSAAVWDAQTRSYKCRFAPQKMWKLKSVVFNAGRIECNIEAPHDVVICLYQEGAHRGNFLIRLPRFLSTGKAWYAVSLDCPFDEIRVMYLDRLREESHYEVSLRVEEILPSHI